MTKERDGKTAKLWEKTIVRAMRDLQWHYKGVDHQWPDLSLEFDGNAERALGDGVVSADDKLYLLEMKALAADKKKEWAADPVKLPFRTLSESLEGQSKNDDRSMHVLSMRGHFFVYWEALEAFKKSTNKPGALVVSSYLLDIAEQSPVVSHPRAKALINRFSLGTPAGASDPDLFIPVHELLAARLFASKPKLLDLSGKSERRVRPLGLTVDQMQRYVLWLVKEQKDEDLPINALLLSRSGSLCQHVSRVGELSKLVEKLKGDHAAGPAGDLRRLERPRLLEEKSELAVHPDAIKNASKPPGP